LQKTDCSFYMIFRIRISISYFDFIFD